MADVESCDASYVAVDCIGGLYSIYPHLIRAVQIFHELFETYQVRVYIHSTFPQLTTTSFIFVHHLWSIQSRGVGVFITHLRSGPRKMFDKAGVVKLLGDDAFYDNLADAMARVERH